jgi:uncharacterized protein YceH (UPF0502 family)
MEFVSALAAVAPGDWEQRYMALVKTLVAQPASTVAEALTSYRTSIEQQLKAESPDTWQALQDRGFMTVARAIDIDAIIEEEVPAVEDEVLAIKEKVPAIEDAATATDEARAFPAFLA